MAPVQKEGKEGVGSEVVGVDEVAETNPSEGWNMAQKLESTAIELLDGSLIPYLTRHSDGWLICWGLLPP